MSARLYTIVKRAIPKRPDLSLVPAEILPPNHGRQVRGFVENYVSLQALCSSAQSRNNALLMVELIDRLKAMEKRIRFVEAP